MSNCRFFNGACIDAGPCSAYTGKSLVECQDLYNAANVKCWWVSGRTCSDRLCSTAPTDIGSSIACENYLSGCRFNGARCVAAGRCSSYTVFGVDSTAKQLNCKNMTSTDGSKCWYSEGT